MGLHVGEHPFEETAQLDGPSRGACVLGNSPEVACRHGVFAGGLALRVSPLGSPQGLQDSARMARLNVFLASATSTTLPRTTRSAAQRLIAREQVDKPECGLRLF